MNWFYTDKADRLFLRPKNLDRDRHESWMLFLTFKKPFWATYLGYNTICTDSVQKEVQETYVYDPCIFQVNNQRKIFFMLRVWHLSCLYIYYMHEFNVCFMHVTYVCIIDRLWNIFNNFYISKFFKLELVNSSKVLITFIDNFN